MSALAPCLTGSKAIARALGCSPRTIKRQFAKGKGPLAAKLFKVGDHTSPLKILRSDLDAERRKSRVEGV